MGKNDFLMHEFFILSIGGAFQRGNVYKKENALEDDRTKFRKELEKELIKICEEYVEEEITGEKHIENINKLINFSKNRNFLNGEQLKFGIVQKLLNLYLKYLWCSGKIKMPPHCPFDRIILEKLGRKENWTQMDNFELYKKWVESARNLAEKNNLKIAEWELDEKQLSMTR